MTEGCTTMSQREVDRLGVIQAVQSKELRQREAARQLGGGDCAAPRCQHDVRRFPARV
jgi:hypothetical protein